MSSVDPLLVHVDAAREGDDAAVQRLVEATQPALWRTCAALGSSGEVEDLVQETYLRALGALSRFRGDAPVQIWLLSIARRVCADHVRKRQRLRRLRDRVTAQASVAAAEPAPDVVDDLVAGLAPERREAFVLTQLVGLSYEEAASVVGCPVGTIRSRVARARADLVLVLARVNSR